MGLTIHYSLKTEDDENTARKLVNALHQSAQDLPFKEIGDVVELAGDKCDYEERGQDDPLRWMLIQAQRGVDVPENKNVWLDAKPLRVIGFTTWPGQGCEQANFGLCKYPEFINCKYGRIATKADGWRWHSFCKTQYASDPQCGGIPHFLRCHLSVVAMLDRSRALGCLDCAHDEGGFWEKRNLPALVSEIGSWNEMIAAFGGRLKDALGDRSNELEMAIARFPNFEHLEAAGQNKLPPGLESVINLIAQVGASLKLDPGADTHSANPR